MFDATARVGTASSVDLSAVARLSSALAALGLAPRALRAASDQLTGAIERIEAATLRVGSEGAVGPALRAAVVDLQAAVTAIQARAEETAVGASPARAEIARILRTIGRTETAPRSVGRASSSSGSGAPLASP